MVPSGRFRSSATEPSQINSGAAVGGVATELLRRRRFKTLETRTLVERMLDDVEKLVDRPEVTGGCRVKRLLHQVVEIGSASCRERVCQYVESSVVAVTLKKNTK